MGGKEKLSEIFCAKKTVIHFSALKKNEDDIAVRRGVCAGVAA
jgi:hypothetical protein